MIRAYVDFSRKIREWDGFGVSLTNKNCRKRVLTPTLFHDNNGNASENNHKKITELLFGNNGLRVSLIKTFLNFSDQKQYSIKHNESDLIESNECSSNPLDDTTCKFCDDAIAASALWGGTLRLLCTFTNPPGWMTKQKITGGKDLEPSCRIDYARVMIAGVKFLLEKQYPVKYLSMHYHGEDWECWTSNQKENDQGLLSLYWPPEQVVDFLKLLRRMLDKNGLTSVGLTPGEICSSLRLVDWGYTNAILDDPVAIQSLGLLTYDSDPSNPLLVTSSAIDEIRKQRPDIHAWFTALNSNTQTSLYLMQIRNIIYNSKINALILEDIFGLSDETRDSSDLSFNDKCAFSVPDAFYYLKLLCHSGQPATSICQVACNTKGAALIAFSGNTTKTRDSFVLINASDKEYDLPIEIRGSANGIFSVFRTSSVEKYHNIGNVHVKEGKILYKALSFSVTAFYGSI